MTDGSRASVPSRRRRAALLLATAVLCFAGAIAGTVYALADHLTDDAVVAATPSAPPDAPEAGEDAGPTGRDGDAALEHLDDAAAAGDEALHPETFAAREPIDGEPDDDSEDDADEDGEPEEASEPVAAPASVEVPAIDVGGDLVDLGLREDRAMEVPDFGDVGWYEPGPRPGEAGGAVIAAHYDSYEGPDVFFQLPHLEEGDEVRVTAGDGHTSEWRVSHAEETPKDELPTDRLWPGRRRAAARAGDLRWGVRRGRALLHPQRHRLRRVRRLVGVGAPVSAALCHPIESHEEGRDATHPQHHRDLTARLAITA